MSQLLTWITITLVIVGSILSSLNTDKPIIYGIKIILSILILIFSIMTALITNIYWWLVVTVIYIFILFQEVDKWNQIK